MKQENDKQCECSHKIIVPEGKLCAYCNLLDMRSNTCSKTGDDKYFHLYCLVNYQSCPIYNSR